MGKTANEMWLIIYDDGTRCTLTGSDKTDVTAKAERYTTRRVNKVINVADFIRDAEKYGIQED